MKRDDFLTSAHMRPSGGQIVWAKANDGVQLRLGFWPAENAKGTVLLFNGRTEFIEKYGPAAKDFADRGYATATLDWRGQGLSHRDLDDRMLGYVKDFSDYQKDVAALLEEAAKAGMPKPYFLVAHSMGGAIGLRALINGLDVKAAAFSAPMWGIEMSAILRPFAGIIGSLCKTLGYCGKPVHGTERDNYALVQPFEGNTLTSDPELYAFMGDAVKDVPDLGLGSPTYGWVYEALVECQALSREELPNIETYISLGNEESVVLPQAIEFNAARWPQAKLQKFDGCLHEIMMEVPDLRNAFIDQSVALFERNL